MGNIYEALEQQQAEEEAYDEPYEPHWAGDTDVDNKMNITDLGPSGENFPPSFDTPDVKLTALYLW